MKLSILIIAIMVALAYAADPAQPAQPAPGRKVPGDAITQKNSEDVLELLQGGNSDVFIVIFFVGSSASAKDELKGKIQNEIGKEHGWIRITEVDLNNVNDYNKLLRVLKMEGEPKRGHSVPQVLVMSKGEGFVIRGPNIVDGIKKRINRVEDGTLFKQGLSGVSGGQGYSVGA